MTSARTKPVKNPNQARERVVRIGSLKPPLHGFPGRRGRPLTPENRLAIQTFCPLRPCSRCHYLRNLLRPSFPQPAPRTSPGAGKKTRRPALEKAAPRAPDGPAQQQGLLHGLRVPRLCHFALVVCCYISVPAPVFLLCPKMCQSSARLVETLTAGV